MTIEEIEAAIKASRPMPTVDVVRARMEFPFVTVLYPLGFPVEISSNSEIVLRIANESWGAFEQRFDRPPICIQIGIIGDGMAEQPPVPVCRVQQHLFSFVADEENYGLIDMIQGFCCIWLTHAAIKDRSYLRHFYLECAIVCPIATRFTTGVHAGCVSRDGVGVLLCGDSGAGKSTLSYACAKAGWTYITDDASYIVHGDADLRVVGNCHQVRFRPAAGAFFPEIECGEVTQRAGTGKPSIELSPRALNISFAQSANVKYLVILNRREGFNASLRPYSKDVVRRFLLQGRFSPLEMMPAHYAAIEQLLDREVFELRYTNLNWAIERLDALVARGTR